MSHHPSFATMTGRTLALALVVAGLAVIAPDAASGAVWLAEGLAIAPADGVQSDAVLAADGQGGAFVAWQDYRSGGIAIFAQHVRADGTVAPGWPAGGLAWAKGAASDPAILPDGLGGAFVAAADGSSLHLWHLAADATLSMQSFGAARPASADPARARRARPFDTDKVTPTVLPDLCSDGAGGAFVAWEEGGFLRTAVRVRDLLRGRGAAPTWTAGGALGPPDISVDLPPGLGGRGGRGGYVPFLPPADSGLVH